MIKFGINGRLNGESTMRVAWVGLLSDFLVDYSLKFGPTLVGTMGSIMTTIPGGISFRHPLPSVSCRVLLACVYAVIALWNSKEFHECALALLSLTSCGFISVSSLFPCCDHALFVS